MRTDNHNVHIMLATNCHQFGNFAKTLLLGSILYTIYNSKAQVLWRVWDQGVAVASKTNMCTIQSDRL